MSNDYTAKQELHMTASIDEHNNPDVRRTTAAIGDKK